MADAEDLKSSDGNIVWVRPPPALCHRLVLSIDPCIWWCWRKKDDYQNALDYLSRAQEMRIKFGNKTEISNGYMGIADFNRHFGKFELALMNVKRGVDIAKEINNLPKLQFGYKVYYKIYEDMGDYEKAYDYAKLFTHIKDSILNENSAEQIAELEVTYETEKKKKKIELLTKEKELTKLKLDNYKIPIYSFSIGLILVIVLTVFIYFGYREKKKVNVELTDINYKITNQKLIIEEKNKDITDSIKYAKKIQEAILPSDERLASLLPNSFVVYLPKDIVSGDFYWVEEVNKKVCFAAVDCTGHGVPGAFMSIIGNNGLNQAVLEEKKDRPDLILNSLNDSVNNTLKQTLEEPSVKDGMDLSLCSIEYQEDGSVLNYAGAFNPLWIISEEELIEYKADRQPIGSFMGMKPKPFTNHEVKLSKGDTIYVFTDGFADQFGGENGKKYKYARMKEFLLSISNRSLNEQKELIIEEFNNWKGNIEQIDDVCIIGVRV